jgi:archaellum biogenesis protein FlaJ (TadC family)
MIMNNNALKTEFVSGGVGITREDYESLPCAMYAMEFTDDQMQELVDRIANVLSSQYGYNEYEISCLEEDSQELEDYYDAFWREMENAALDMGMRYYEDISDEEYMKIIGK